LEDKKEMRANFFFMGGRDFLRWPERGWSLLRASVLVPKNEQLRLGEISSHGCSPLSFLQNSLSLAQAYAMEIPVALLPAAKPIGLTSTELLSRSEDKIYLSGFLNT
jgi:hypothetical protein